MLMKNIRGAIEIAVDLKTIENMSKSMQLKV